MVRSRERVDLHTCFAGPYLPWLTEHEAGPGGVISLIRSRPRHCLVSVLIALMLVPLVAGPVGAGVGAAGSPAQARLPYQDPRVPVGKRVADLLGRMTLVEKIGQMTQTERGAVFGDPTLIAQWQVGSVLSGGGSTPPVNTPASWVDMVNTFQAQALSTRLTIPMIYGIDAVHGHGNVLGATVFPHNIGLGSSRDPALAAEIGRATAAEVRATGIPWDFSPCICVTRDERWGRSYE